MAGSGWPSVCILLLGAMADHGRHLHGLKADSDLDAGEAIHTVNSLAGLVVKGAASGAEEPGFESRLRRNFSGSSHTRNFKTDTPVATLPGD